MSTPCVIRIGGNDLGAASSWRRLFLLLLLFVVALGALCGRAAFAASVPPVVISEFLAENHAGLVDDDGEHSDWIEVFNQSPEAVNLKGWSLTDQADAPRKWVFPEISLPAGRFLLVFASGNDRRTSSRPLHTNFKLGKKGDYLALVQPDGAGVATEYAPKYPPQRSDVAYGLPESFFAPSKRAAPTQLPNPTYLPIPTPGSPNLPGSETELSAPVFSLPSGLYPGDIQLQITVPSREIRVHYTTDGSRPSATNGLLYTGPISLHRSAVIRAIAERKGAASSSVTTATYLLESFIRQQNGEGSPTQWGVREGKSVTADYDMDPEVLNPITPAQFHEALTSLPSLSLVVDPADLFNTEHGIYSNPMESGGDWERSASIEILPWRTEPGSHVDCGVRIQGGWNRRPEESPKHAFRLIFKKRHGPALWKHPLFGDGVDEFNEVILRAGCNNSWLHWSGEERKRGEYLRDQWMRETYAAMGHLSARGRFVHLFINGLYWGVYNSVERPDAAFLRAHLGGKSSDYEVRNADRILEGGTNAWVNMLRIANEGLASPQRFTEISAVLDIPAFIDYMALNLYGANADYDRSSNWYAYRPDQPGGRFHFIVWDGERTLEEVGSNTIAYDDDQSPPRLFQKLRENPEFKALFTKRVHLLLGPGGALSPEESQKRYRRLAAMIEKPMLLESARWGDYRRDVHRYKTEPYELYTVEQHWKPEVRRLLEDYFPARGPELMKQLKAVGLY